jgi:D-serine deaminase-like pyridoxal phosphate-dependent protein
MRPGSYVYGDAQQVVLMVEAARAWWDLVAALGWQASGIGPPPAGQTWSAVSSLDRLL